MKITQQKSDLFENDISIKRNKNEYVNLKIMQKKQIKYLKDIKNIYELNEKNKLFWATEAPKYHHKNDRYNYEVLEEPKKSAIFWNAMALVHCKDSYVIFQNENDIKDAENAIKEKGIYRIEDYQ